MERLKGKRILIVDDEPDILETLKELLSSCEIKEASSFKAAKELLETQHFDIAILDIMGVEGFDLLEIALTKKVIAVMLTAHALTPESIIKSYKKGAASFVPKDKLANIIDFINDVLEAQVQGKHVWWRWFDRLGNFFEKKFGLEWQEKDKAFWKDFPHYL